MGGGKGGIIGAIGNFSIQYNLTSASIALAVMATASGIPEKPDWSRYFLLSVVFVGCMVGMLVMGRLGDIIGRSKAMQITTGLTVLGAIVPACASGSANVWYGVIIFGRLILGIGVGGIYPLSAASAAESGVFTLKERAAATAVAFFYQAPGAIVPYGCALLLNQYLERETLFRVLFVLGAIPAGIVFLASASEPDSEEFSELKKEAEGMCKVLQSQSPTTKKLLLGTCLTWFWFDVAYYGTAIFVPNIIRSIYGDDESLGSLAQHSGVVAACVIPGCLLSVCAFACLKVGPKKLNIAGFLFQAVCFSVFAWAFYTDQSDNIKFSFMLVLQFSLAFGPNVATYVAPVVSFPAEVRSTFHGLSAMSGKLGAVVGAFVFVPLQDLGGITSVLILQCVIVILGALSALLLEDFEDDEEDEEMTEMEESDGYEESENGFSCGLSST